MKQFWLIFIVWQTVHSTHTAHHKTNLPPLKVVNPNSIPWHGCDGRGGTTDWKQRECEHGRDRKWWSHTETHQVTAEVFSLKNIPIYLSHVLL